AQTDAGAAGSSARSPRERGASGATASTKPHASTSSSATGSPGAKPSRAEVQERHHVTPQRDSRAQEARDNLKDKGVDVKGENNIITISGDKHDVTKRDSYVQDVNSRIAAAKDAAEIQKVTDQMKKTLEESSVEELRELWPAKS